MKATITLCLLASASGALAHYNWDRLIINGQQTGQYEYVRRTSNSNSPITNLSSNDLRCNAGGSSGASTSTATVAAGSTIGLVVGSGVSHPGPLNIYMWRAPADAKSYDGSGSWFKIWEQGPAGFNPLSWKSDGKSTFTFKIPASTPAGEYLVRGEHIAIHGAYQPNGSQFYIGCAQVKVTGAGAGNPGPLVKLPGAYSPNDPGLFFSPYYPVPTNYTMPGPNVWSDALAVNPVKARSHARELV